MNNMTELEQCRAAYITAMLWAEVDDNSEPLEDSVSADGIADESWQGINLDVQAFMLRVKTQGIRFPEGYTWEQAGHDFWLTRAGHGTGFWDRKELGADGEVLTTIAKDFSERWPYIGDDGLLYVH